MTRALPPAVHDAIAAYATGGAMALAEVAFDEANGWRHRVDESRRSARRAYEQGIVQAVRRRLGLRGIGVPVVEVRSLIDHRDKTARALITVRCPLRGSDVISAHWVSGGDEPLEAWLARVAEACRILLNPTVVLPVAAHGGS